MSRRLSQLAFGVCLGFLAMASAATAQSPVRAVNRPAAVNGFYDIKPPADKAVTLDLGDVTVTTYSPVTITPVENSTTIYFVATNRATSARTLQYTSYAELLATKPDWLFHAFRLFGFLEGGGSPTKIALAAGETRTFEMYFSKDLAGGDPLSVTLPFRFSVAETSRSGTQSITFIGDDLIMDLRRVKTATISGRVTGPGQQPVANALVNIGIINENQFQSTRTDANGNYSFGVVAIDDIQTILGPRPMPYHSIDYFVTAESEGYTLGYRAGLTPAKGKTVTADLAIQPVAQRAAYTKIGEFASDGKLSYWWIRFAGPNHDRVVAIEGQHPPVLPGTGHVVSVDLSGKQLWRFEVGAQCWGLDVSNDGLLVGVGCDNGNTYVFSYDGTLKWQAHPGDRPGGNFVEDVRFSPDGTKMVADGGGGPGGFTVFNAQTGAVLWTSTGKRTPNADPQEDTQLAYKTRWSADGQRLIAGSNGALSLFTADGTRLWRASMGESPLFLEIDDNYNVYAGGKSRDLFAYDKDGKLRWKYRLAHTPNEAWKGMAANGSRVVMPTFNGVLQAFDAQGALVWQHFLPERPSISPQGLNENRVFGPGHNSLSMTPSGSLTAVGSRAWQVLVYDRDGALLWSDTRSQRADFTGEDPSSTGGHYSGTNAIEISPDGKYIVAGYADSVIRIFQATTPPPAMYLDRAALNFSATSNGTAFAAQTAAQQVRLTQSGSGTVTWTATSNQPWLTVSPSSGSGSAVLTIGTKFVSGLAASSSGAITITLSGASAASAGPISASLAVLNSTTSAAPTGSFDTPVDQSTGLTGSIAITGWALDDVEVTEVQIWRDPNPGDPPGAVFTGPAPQAGKVFVGLASFVEGARPDVQTGNPAAPLNARAGWGYLMLTRGLIWDGKGPFKLYAIALDREGHLAQIGSKTITIDNGPATNPFGAIDTPGQGSTASDMYPNTGWVLTPNKGATISASGVQVAVDGVFVPGVPSVSDRADISAGFPTFSTSGAGRGLFVDTTLFANGPHTIGWLVTDSTGKADGIGSRFFTIANSALRAAETEHLQMTTTALEALDAAEARMTGRRGFDRQAPFVRLPVTQDGRPVLDAEELDRIEVRLDEGTTDEAVGYLRIGGRLTPLPIGSHLAGSTFTWQPGPGFLGSYELVFVRERDGVPVARQALRITIHPQGTFSRDPIPREAR